MNKNQTKDEGFLIQLIVDSFYQVHRSCNIVTHIYSFISHLHPFTLLRYEAHIAVKLVSDGLIPLIFLVIQIFILSNKNIDEAF